MPVTRRRVALEKFGALLVGAAGLAVILWAALAVLGPPFDLDLDLGNLAAICVGCFMLAALYGSVALAIGCATGSRGLAIGLTGGAAVAAYVVNALAPAVDALDPVRELSPFYYYLGADPLRNGLALGHLGVLAAATVALVGIAVLAFDRRDLAT